MTAFAPPAGDHWTAAGTDFPLIAHSHLRWDFAWQRPQQVLSRMAATRPVLFVEEPILLDDVRGERLEITQPAPNVYRAVPRLPGYLRDRYDHAIATIRALVQRAVGRGGPLAGRFDGAVQWFYSPMPAPAMLGAFNERGVVYDCMDELAQFRFAPSDLAARERLLLENADLVFTGRHELYTSKARFHPNVHFLGCGVDAARVAAARAPETAVPADVAHDFTPVARVAHDAGEFAAAAAELAAAPDAAMVARGLEKARAASWESIVARMNALLSDAVTTPDATLAAVAAGSPALPASSRTS